MRNTEAPEVKLAVVALNLWFIGQMISIALPAVTEAGPGQWMTSIAALLMVIAGMMQTLGRWQSFAPDFQNLVIFGTIVLIPMTLQTLFQGMDDPLYTALMALPWFAAVFLPSLGYPRIPNSFLICFRWHATVGVFVAAFVIWQNWGILSAESIRRDETLGIKVVQFLFYSLFFQVFHISSESLFHRVIALVGMAEMLLIAFGSGTRQPLFLLSMVIAMAIFATLRSLQGLAASAARKLTAISLVFLFSGASVYFILNNLRGAVDLLETRIRSDREGTSLRENARLFEIEQLIGQFGPVDYVFGRGFVGEFVNTAAPKQDNVHIGWFRTLLKGGVPLVILFLLGYVAVAIRSAARSRDPIVLAASFIVIYFGIKNVTGNIVLANGHFYIVAICVGTVYGALTTFTPSFKR